MSSQTIVDPIAFESAVLLTAIVDEITLPEDLEPRVIASQIHALVGICTASFDQV